MSKKHKRLWLRLLALMLAVVALTSVAVADDDTAEQDIYDTLPGEPTPTPTPTPTAAPDASSEEPETTDAPEITEEPDVTDEPEVTEEPEVTDEPEVTEVPEVTDEPEITEKPEITDEPEITEDPEITDEPEITEEPEELTDLSVDVTLPYDASFTIMVFEGLGEGVIVSDKYTIVNNGDTTVYVEIVSVTLEIEGVGTYDVLMDDKLPESGSAIFAELVCSDDYSDRHVTLTPYPMEYAYTYLLFPGAEGHFSFNGVVSEDAESKWADANVSVKLGFRFG